MRLPCLFLMSLAASALPGCAVQGPSLDALVYGAAQLASPAVRQVAERVRPGDSVAIAQRWF
jgi:hypothetical protein